MLETLGQVGEDVVEVIPGIHGHWIVQLSLCQAFLSFLRFHYLLVRYNVHDQNIKSIKMESWKDVTWLNRIILSFHCVEDLSKKLLRHKSINFSC